MLKRSFTFNAIFTYDIDGISINFPDLPGCISCSFSREEAFKMAKEALELYLDGTEEKEIPESRVSEIETIHASQELVPIEVTLTFK